MELSGTVKGEAPRSLSDEAYYAVREKILRGQLPLGTPVSSRGLAQEFGMSHQPVAQALRQLEVEGFLESRPRVGTRVRVPTAQDIRDRYEVREALESQSARLFAQHATAAQRRELLRIAEQLDAMFNQASAGTCDAEYLFAVHSFHFDLHLKIAQYARCCALREMIERNQVLTFNWLYDVATHRHSPPPRFHQELARKLTSGDPRAADEAMRAHVRYGRDERIRQLQLDAATDWRERRSSGA
jgi:GntR family transcriptional regulator, rspAB operon transcriptional repressor